jgi:arylformamidase
VLQVAQALAWVWRHARAYGANPDHIVVAGHSAGGHLATMMLACEWRTPSRRTCHADLVKAALSISGIYELEPLRHAPFLATDIALTRAIGRRLSPPRCPRRAARWSGIVGADESEEFLRQAA